MQAIQVKYISPTNTKPARVKAIAHGRSLTISLDHELDHDAAYAKAAIELCKLLKWKGTLIGGGLKDGSEVFVFSNSKQFNIK